MQDQNRNVVVEIGNLIAASDKSLGDIWLMKSVDYQNLSVQEQIAKLIRYYRPVFCNMQDISGAVREVFNDTLFSDEWLRNFNTKVVPVIIKYGIA